MAKYGNVEEIRAFFSSGLEIALGQWHELVTQPGISTGEISQERDIILNSVEMSFKDNRLWPASYQVIEAITPHIEITALWREWSRILNDAIAVCNDVGESRQLAGLYHSLGRALLPLNEYSTGEAAYRKAIKFARLIGDEVNEARACSNLGYYYIDRGHWLRSEVLCCHALTIFERLGNDHGRAHTLNHLGLLYTRQGLWDEGETCLKDACDIWERNKDSYGLMLGFMNIGTLYHDRKNGDMAAYWGTKALRYADELEDRYFSTRIKTNIGAAYMIDKKYAEAKIFLLDSTEAAKEIHDVIGLGRAKMNLGEVYIQQGETEAGLSLLEESIMVFKKAGNIDALISGARYLLAATATTIGC